MRAIYLTCIIGLFVYTFFAFILLKVKEVISGKKARGISMFNMILIVYMLILICHFCFIIFFDFADPMSFRNQLVAKMYLFFYYCFIVVYTVYNCHYGFDFDLHLGFKHNVASTILTISAIFSTLCIFGFSIDISYGNPFYTITGASYRYVFVISFFTYLITLIVFAFQFKKIDVFKALGPLSFFFLIFICLYFHIVTGFPFFEIIMLFNIVFVYYAIEKREEKLQVEIVNTTLSLEKANRFKSDFLSSMSHEIKTPLNSILATSRMILDKDTVNYSIKKQVNDIVFASDQLKETIMNILTISKSEIDKLTVSHVTFNIDNEIKTLPFVEKINIDSAGVSFLINMDENIPKLLVGSKDLIRSIIDNALTYTMESIDGGTLTLGVSYKDGNLIITVDSLDSNNKDIYANIDNIDVDIYSVYENKDFGMGIANILIDKLNGTITSKHEGSGNVLIISIPCEENSSEIDFDNVKFTGKKALVVDDTEINLKVANRVLSSLDFECEFLHSGYDAIEFVKTHHFDIIFLDIMMPNMSGEETLKHLLSQEDFDSPVIALTADEVGGAREKYLSEGFKGYIVKPFTKEDVINEVIDILGGENK